MLLRRLAPHARRGAAAHAIGLRRLCSTSGGKPAAGSRKGAAPTRTPSSTGPQHPQLGSMKPPDSRVTKIQIKTMVAACAVYVARKNLGRNAWSPTLLHYAQYAESDLHACLKDMHGVLHSTKGSLAAVKKKYSSEKYGTVATMPAGALSQVDVDSIGNQALQAKNRRIKVCGLSRNSSRLLRTAHSSHAPPTHLPRRRSRTASCCRTGSTG